eukprot:719399_1
MTDKQVNEGESILRLQETISRLREALASMNKDYMETKLELDQMKGSSKLEQQQNCQEHSDNEEEYMKQQKPDLGAQLLKFSSKVKAFQSNINTKLATAGLQMNKLEEDKNGKNSNISSSNNKNNKKK